MIITTVIFNFNSISWYASFLVFENSNIRIIIMFSYDEVNILINPLALSKFKHGCLITLFEVHFLFKDKFSLNKKCISNCIVLCVWNTNRAHNYSFKIKGYCCYYKLWTLILELFILKYTTYSTFLKKNYNLWKFNLTQTFLYKLYSVIRTLLLLHCNINTVFHIMYKT